MSDLLTEQDLWRSEISRSVGGDTGAGAAAFPEFVLVSTTYQPLPHPHPCSAQQRTNSIIINNGKQRFLFDGSVLSDALTPLLEEEKRLFQRIFQLVSSEARGEHLCLRTLLLEMQP